MIVKIDSNVEKEGRKKLNLFKDFQKEIELSIFETFQLARDRTVKQIIKGGAEKRGTFSFYRSVRGATIPRRSKRTGRVGTIPFFHKTKIIERTGDFLNLIKREKSNWIQEIIKLPRKMIGIYGFKGRQSGKVLKLELGQRGGKRRKPIFKGLKFAGRRFLTILGRREQPIINKVLR